MTDAALPYSNQQRVSKKKKTTILVGVAVIVVVLIGSILILRQPNKTNETKSGVVENKEPSPTQKPEIDKKSVKIQVLNGTGTPGQASTAQKALEEAEYNGDNIESGNAEAYDATVTTIAAKKGFEDVASDIKDALKAAFDEIKIDSTPLDEDSKFDIIVTTGGEKFEEEETTTTPSPTETPTPTPTLSPTPTP